MKAIVTIIRILVGALFIFSGAVKAIDPLGTSYKMNDYFTEFGLEFMNSFTVSFAVIMIVLEIVLGVALLIGYRPKWVSISLLAIVVFFTFLTGFTYLSGYEFDGFFNFSSWNFNEKNMKVTDCGCFGDFLKLHPKESFQKDLVLFVLISFLLFYHSKIDQLFKQKLGDALMVATTLFSLLFCFSNYVWDLPVADFRPYAIGNHIPEQMEGIPDEVDYVFVYKNKSSGESKAFKMDELTTIDQEAWEYVSRDEIVLKEGVRAKIENFYVNDEHGNDLTDTILGYPGYTFMIVAYTLDKTKASAFEKKINPLAKAAEEAGMKAFALSSSEFEDFRHEHQTAYPFYSADGTFLKTIIRSNPGVVLIKDGTVIDKWHHRKLPEFASIVEEHQLPN